MPFDITKFNKIGGDGNYNLYLYSDAGSISDIKAASYFDTLLTKSGAINIGDIIVCANANGIAFLKVTAISPNITTSTALATTAA